MLFGWSTDQFDPNIEIVSAVQYSFGVIIRQNRQKIMIDTDEPQIGIVTESSQVFAKSLRGPHNPIPAKDLSLAVY